MLWKIQGMVYSWFRYVKGLVVGLPVLQESLLQSNRSIFAPFARSLMTFMPQFVLILSRSVTIWVASICNNDESHSSNSFQSWLLEQIWSSVYLLVDDICIHFFQKQFVSDILDHRKSLQIRRDYPSSSYTGDILGSFETHLGHSRIT